MDERAIRVRRYAAMVWLHWRLVAAVTALVVVAAVAYGLSIPPTYEARTQLLLSGPRLQFDLEPRLRTTPDNLNNLLISNVRYQTVTQIATSTEVEAAVQQRLTDVLPASMHRPQTLLKAISVRSRPGQEYVEINASWGDPEFAARLADVWAEETAKRIDSIFGPSTAASAIDQQLAQARPPYEAAEQEVIRLSSYGPLEEATQRVKAKEEEISALQEVKTGYLKQRAGGLYSTLTDLEQVIRDAETLQQQLIAPATSAAAMSGDALAVTILRARNYLTLPRPIGQGEQSRQVGQSELRLSFDGIATRQSREEASRDLAVMVQALRARHAELQSELQQLGRDLQRLSDPGVPSSGVETSGDAQVGDDPIGAALSRASSELASLRAQMAVLTQQKEDAIRNRDVLKASYTALLSKSEELRVAQAAAGGSTKILQQAVPPGSSLQTGRVVRYVLLAAAGGFVLGVLLALVVEWRRPSQRRSPAVTRGPTAEPAPTQP
jgi:uncharacterized protein involved in exopolysaccharide biosynthesis